MPISMTCRCGKELRAQEKYAGRKVRCPACSAILVVPDPTAATAAEEELLTAQPAEDSSPKLGRRSGSRRDITERPSARRDREDEDERPRRRSKQQDEDEEDEHPRRAPDERDEDESEEESPRPKKRKKKLRSGSGGSGSGANAGVLGGLLMIVIAIVWFVGGLFAGLIFYYPPVLLVLGIVAVVKGLMGSNE